MTSSQGNVVLRCRVRKKDDTAPESLFPTFFFFVVGRWSSSLYTLDSTVSMREDVFKLLFVYLIKLCALYFICYCTWLFEMAYNRGTQYFSPIGIYILDFNYDKKVPYRLKSLGEYGNMPHLLIVLGIKFNFFFTASRDSIWYKFGLSPRKNSRYYKSKDGIKSKECW